MQETAIVKNRVDKRKEKKDGPPENNNTKVLKPNAIGNTIAPYL